VIHAIPGFILNVSNYQMNKLKKLIHGFATSAKILHQLQPVEMHMPKEEKKIKRNEIELVDYIT